MVAINPERVRRGYASEGGGLRQPVAFERAGGGCPFALRAGDLGTGIRQIAVGETQAKAPDSAEQF